MPKNSKDSQLSVVQVESRIYDRVVSASNPERVLKDAIFEVRDVLPPKDLDKVLGGVCVRLERNEKMGRVARYMKDLYGFGASRRLFAPKASIGNRPKHITASKKKVIEEAFNKVLFGGLSSVLAGGVAMMVPENSGHTNNSRPPKRKLSDDGTSGGNGGGVNEKLNLNSIAKYCLETANYYEEVKPVYDMLMELLFLESDSEWLQTKEAIQARLKELDSKTHVTVQGDYVQAKHIANNVEHVEANGVGVMAASVAQKKEGWKRPAKTGVVTDAVYEYRFLQEPDGGKRLMTLYQQLLHYGWIDNTTTPETFENLFTGVPKEFHIKWTGTHSDLYSLIKNLCDNNLIFCPKGITRWMIARCHFVNKKGLEFANWNKQKENAKPRKKIESLVYLLDVTKHLPDVKMLNVKQE